MHNDYQNHFAFFYNYLQLKNEIWSDDVFLKRLFEKEIPEIEDEIIEGKAVKRTPGDRSKIVVYSSDRRDIFYKLFYYWIKTIKFYVFYI